ncbi:MAG: restriction endonuclease subunit R [Xenococcaceae cyanobacterium]
MVEKVSASVVTIDELESRFHLEEVDDDQFFWEWQDNLPEITDSEKQMLDKVKAGYFNLLKHPPLLENPIRMAVIAPLLFFADFFLFPFYIKAEHTIKLTGEDDGRIIEGKIDVLVLKQQFWVTVIESKQAFYSLEAGRAQILSYMLTNPHPEKPSYGMISNGGSFLFLKLVKGENPRYATSDPFDLLKKHTNDLYTVLRILKHLGRLTTNNYN